MLRIYQTYFYFALLLLVSLGAASFRSAETSEARPLYSDDITAYIFLLDQCIISQYYTLPLREMHEEYGDLITFKGIFPTEGITQDRIHAFGTEYKLKFDLSIDTLQVTERLNATVTPEVVLYDEKYKEVIYQGRIDNSYASLGRRRRHTTTHEMLSAIKSIINQKEINIKSTEAVGCYIGRRK